MVAVILPDIISGEIKLENISSMRVFEWLVILVGCTIYGIKELEQVKLRHHLLADDHYNSEDLY